MKWDPLLLGIIVLSSTIPLQAPISNITSDQEDLSLNNYFASNARDGFTQNNLVRFIKDRMDRSATVSIVTESSSYEEEYPLYITLFGPDGYILEKITYIEWFDRHDFHIPASSMMGEYGILITLSSIPDDYFSCCIDLNYRIDYEGLSSPPYVESLGNVFHFYPQHTFSSLRNTGDNLIFGIFLQEGKIYRVEHNPWGQHDIVDSILLFNRDSGRIPALRTSFANPSVKKYFFEVPETNYYQLRVSVNDDNDAQARIMGYRLVEEETNQLIPLLSYPCTNGCDSDFDLLSDDFELSRDLDPYFPDYDGDLVGDGIELKFGSNPRDSRSSPLHYNLNYSRVNGKAIIHADLEFDNTFLDDLTGLELHMFDDNNEIIDTNTYYYSEEDVSSLSAAELRFSGTSKSEKQIAIYTTYYFKDGTIFADKLGFGRKLVNETTLLELITGLITSLDPRIVIPILALLTIIVRIIKKKRKTRMHKSTNKELYPNFRRTK